jgi:FtsH-binding integral membrane protein
MSDFDRGYTRPVAAGPADMAVDAGLRAFMLGVYNKVALGLILSAALAYLTSQVEPVRNLLYVMAPDGVHVRGMTILGMILAFSPLAVILFGSFALRNATPRSSGILYWSIVALMGASLGVLALIYTGASIASTFLITAIAFGGLSLYGYVTKRDLTGFGSFLIVGLIGLIIASVVNMFLHNGMMGFIISVLGVFIFAGLIAYDTQRLKMTYYALGGNQTAMGVATNYGALSLYINFINLFQFLLSIFGSRR